MEREFRVIAVMTCLRRKRRRLTLGQSVSPIIWVPVFVLRSFDWVGQSGRIDLSETLIINKAPGNRVTLNIGKVNSKHYGGSYFQTIQNSMLELEETDHSSEEVTRCNGLPKSLLPVQCDLNNKEVHTLTGIALSLTSYRIGGLIASTNGAEIKATCFHLINIRGIEL